jgi:hypothetical protein
VPLAYQNTLHLRPERRLPLQSLGPIAGFGALMNAFAIELEFGSVVLRAGALVDGHYDPPNRLEGDSSDNRCSTRLKMSRLLSKDNLEILLTQLGFLRKSFQAMLEQMNPAGSPTQGIPGYLSPEFSALRLQISPD